MLKRVLLVVCLWLPALAAAGVEQTLQMVDYVAVDYGGAVDTAGNIANPDEYAEMQDFARAIREQLAALPPGPAREELLALAGRLAARIEARAPAGEIQALAGRIRERMIEAFDVTIQPRGVPDLTRGRALFAEHCVACHGTEGRGDGPLARTLEPAPTDFTDYERYRQRTLHGLYSTITQGVADTGMRGYSELSDSDRWALAFYVGQLAPSPELKAAGAEALARNPDAPVADPRVLTAMTPAEAEGRFGPEAAAIVAFLRSHPERLYGGEAPLDVARSRLQEMVAAYRAGDQAAARRLAIEAYLEGFELVEQALNAVDPELRVKVEHEMLALRNLLRTRPEPEALSASVEAILADLDAVEQRLGVGGLSAASAFSGAFFILVREGLEALLVVAALAAFLIKTGRRDALPYIHAGWLGALAAGFLTWLASVTLIDISGGSRELTEGVAALVAALVLFYVGFWMHDKSSALKWKQFIERAVSRALDSGTLWGLAGLAFIAVYREVFETILFYQALWTQLGAGGRGAAISGFAVGGGVLVVVAWLLVRYSVRLPLRQFFTVSGMLMFVLAVIFAGKGVAALQEAGMIPVNPVAFIRIDWLGIYPNLEALGAQLVLIALGLYLWFGRGPRRSPAGAG